MSLQQLSLINGVQPPLKAAYRWKITKDKIHDEFTQCEVGREGPRNCTAEVELTAQWRCLDDDGEIYYYGLIGGDYDGFEPLDDFCATWAGCTEIQYKNAQGKWEIL